ncbi:hypothetical protein [Dechloromonas sp.]|uniref:DUF6988 family protein n=1 Tax=Dechloromonas sp. TaxID=1917218 RepID=UPI0012054DF6|nr:hypothetical protein [Dechloromonas sp.]MBU3697026.1 hypothetical protein [Dechloromonas sp.]TEX49472.1 MAG: hypothetical protein CFR70_03220 [Rhodocyclaceae bacterium]
MTEEKLVQLIERTAVFHERVQQHVQTLTPYPEVRFITAFQSGLLSLEHAVSALILFEQGLFSSAIALTRPQFESLVRGVWLLHAASENWVTKLSEPLTMESAKRANEGEGLAEMLKQLEANPDAPAGIVAQLREFKEVAWKAMSSYTHGGLHPLSRTMSGYPAQLIYDVIRNGNAVVALSAQLLAILSGNPQNMAPVRQMHTDFMDILPIVQHR